MIANVGAWCNLHKFNFWSYPLIAQGIVRAIKLDKKEQKMNGICTVRKPQPRVETISKKELVELIATMLLARIGETINSDVAYERARNITAALAGLMVEE